MMTYLEFTRQFSLSELNVALEELVNSNPGTLKTALFSSLTPSAWLALYNDYLNNTPKHKKHAEDLLYSEYAKLVGVLPELRSLLLLIHF